MKRLTSSTFLALFQVLILAVGGACSSSDGGDTRLSKARTRWEKATVSTYAFVYERSCFCPEEATAPVRVVVESGAVTSATFADGSAAGERGVTVDQLLDEIEGWIDADADSFEASYDPELGYPVEASVDRYENAADDEMQFRITCFSKGDIGAAACPLTPPPEG